MNLAQETVNGLVLGAGYALLAVGWTVLLGAARLVNFAQGQLYMLGAFASWYILAKTGLPYLASIPLAVVVVAALGLVIQTAMTRLTMQQNLVSLMVVTLGIGYLLEGGATKLFGTGARTLASPLEDDRLTIGSAFFTGQDLLIIVVALVLFAIVWVTLSRTRIGIVVRSVAEDPKLAQLFGVHAGLVYLGLFVFSAAAAALSGALLAPRSPILTTIGFDQLVITFVVVVLGGIGSVLGNLAAGLGLGLFTSFFGAYVSPAYTTPVAFAVVLVILAVRPQGLARA